MLREEPWSRYIRVFQMAASGQKNTRLTCTCSKTNFLVVWTKNTFIFKTKARNIIFAFANYSAQTLHCIRLFPRAKQTEPRTTKTLIGFQVVIVRLLYLKLPQKINV